jgi:hypothetical protein
MNGLIVRHFYFWRREIPAENIWADRKTDNQDLYEVRPGKPDRFIPASSIVSRVPKAAGHE